jgi:hypothetical protein
MAKWCWKIGTSPITNVMMKILVIYDRPTHFLTDIHTVIITSIYKPTHSSYKLTNKRAFVLQISRPLPAVLGKRPLT